MTVRSSISLTQVDAKSPVNETLMTSLRNNDLNHEERLVVQESYSTNWTSQLGTSLSATNMGAFTSPSIVDNANMKTILEGVGGKLDGVKDYGIVAASSMTETVHTFVYPSGATPQAIYTTTGIFSRRITGVFVLHYSIESKVFSTTHPYSVYIYSPTLSINIPIVDDAINTSYVRTSGSLVLFADATGDFDISFRDNIPDGYGATVTTKNKGFLCIGDPY